MLKESDLNQIKNAMLDTLEPLFTRIFKKLDSHDKNFSNIENQIFGLKTDVSELKTDVSALKTDVASLKELQPLIEESHQWLGILVDNKEFQKAEIDNVTYKVARIEGVLQGFANSLEPFKKAE